MEHVLTSEEAIRFMGKTENQISYQEFAKMFDFAASSIQEKLIINYAQIKIDQKEVGAQSDALSMTIASYDNIVPIVMTSEGAEIPTVNHEDDDLEFEAQFEPAHFEK